MRARPRRLRDRLLDGVLIAFIAVVPPTLIIAALCTLVLAGTEARDAWIATHVRPAICRIVNVEAEADGNAFRPILHVQIWDGTVDEGAYRWSLPTEPTREEALATAERRKEGVPISCFYHREYRSMVSVEAPPHGWRAWARTGLLAVLVLIFGGMAVPSTRLSYQIFIGDPRTRRARRDAEDDDSPPPDPSTAAGREALDIDGLWKIRPFLPETPPPGWSVPVAMKAYEWVADAGDQGVILTLARKGNMRSVEVMIITRGGKGVPPSDERCREILGEVRYCREWFEGKGDSRLPGMRRWLALPRTAKPPRPKSPPTAPVDAPLTRAMKRAREHFPEKLPADWSPPLSVTSELDLDWTEGGWMFAVDDHDLVALVTMTEEYGVDQLAVCLFHVNGDSVSEAAAAQVLRHFRGVAYFAQGKREAGAMYVHYLGTLEKKLDASRVN
jgi:hypothetical protein